MYTFPNVNRPTTIGEINPGITVIIPLTPSTIPAKDGDKSTILASGPVVTAPCTAVANVRNTIAAVELQPEKASAATNNPLIMQQKVPASFLTFVLDIFCDFKRLSPSIEKKYANNVRMMCGNPDKIPVYEMFELC